MTIANQDLIDAAKAIGIEATIEDPLCLGSYCVITKDFDVYDPLKNKSQLMDLQFKLKLEVNFFPEGGGYLNHKNIQGFMHFANNFESFAEAIILAAAEIGRVMK